MFREILSTKTVLYAEDNDTLRASIVELLSRYFATVYEAKDGKEALEIYHRHMPDVVFSDIDMPLLDGLELSTKIRQDSKTKPIVIISAYSDTPKLLKAIELSLVKYLIKPIKPSEFKEALKKIADELLAYDNSLVCLSSDIYWDKKTSSLVSNPPIHLTTTEESILQLLISRINKCVTYQEIMLAWDINKDISIDTIKFHVSSLRKKLPKDTISNVYAKGYKLKV